MRIVVAGGSGFLGGALVRAWRGDGHEVKVLTRHPASVDDVPWAPQPSGGGWRSTIEGAGAVVNLAGEGIADQRWTEARKAAILSSRVAATRALAHAVRECPQPPRIFISASALGYYGAGSDEPLTEESAPGSDEEKRWLEREKKLRTIIITPAMILVWIFGLLLAHTIGAWTQPWFLAKFAIVVALSGYHGWMVDYGKKLEKGIRPVSGKALRIMNEVPGLAVVLIVVLVIVRPF